MYTNYCKNLISHKLNDNDIDCAEIIKIAHGDDHFVILTSSGKLITVCSDVTNDYYSLSQPEYIDNYNIVDVVAGGQHVVALTHDNKLLSWGSNGDGQQRYTGQCHLNPPDKIIQSLCAGTYYTACSFNDGTIYIAGDNSDGQCEGEFSSVSRIYAGGEGNLFCLLDEGLLTSWGRKEKNYTIDNVIKFAPGHYHHIAIKKTGEIVGFGKSVTSELRIPDVDGLNVRDVCVNGELPGHSFILLEDGTLHAFGNNTHGQLSSQFEFKNDISGVIEGEWRYVSTGLTWSVAITRDNVLHGWGSFNMDY